MSIRIPNNVLAFAGKNNTAVYEQFVDYYNQYRTNTLKATGLEFQTKTQVLDSAGSPTGTYREISFAEKEHEMTNSLKKEILRVAGIANFSEFPLEAWQSNPQLKWATFAVISMLVDMITPQSIMESTGAFAQVRNVGWGDSAAINITNRDLFAVSKAGRSKRTAQLQTSYTGQVVIIPELRELTVFANFFRILSGQECLAELVSKAVRSMETAISLDIYNTFATAMAAISNTASTGLRVAGYTQAEFTRLSQTVAAWNGGAAPIAIGTQRALSNIIPADANYRYDITSDFVKVGYLRNFVGTDIMVLPQIADYNTPFGLALSDTTIWIVSPSANKLVTVVLEGNTITNTDDNFASANLTVSSTLMKSWGTGIATNAIGATITL